MRERRKRQGCCGYRNWNEVWKKITFGHLVALLDVIRAQLFVLGQSLQYFSASINQLGRPILAEVRALMRQQISIVDGESKEFPCIRAKVILRRA